MNVIDKIKDIIFKIKDYDRLESDYCHCLCYFTNNRMSKPNYKIEVVEEVITDTIGEYMDEGYNEATRKAIEWLKENKERYLYNTGNKGVYIPICSYNMIDEFREYMKGSNIMTALEKFQELPHINSSYEIQEDWAYAPNLYHVDGEWHVSWIHCSEGVGLKDFSGSTPEEAIDKAYKWFHSKFCND